MNQQQSITNTTQLSLEQLIIFARYVQIAQVFNKSRLTLSDADVNLRQTSQYYMRKRKQPTSNKSQKSSHKKHQEPINTVKKSIKVQNDKVETTRSSPSMKKVQLVSKNENKQDLMNLKKQLFSKNPSRKKIEIVSKPQNHIQDLQMDEFNLCCFKPYEKQYLQQYQSQLNVKSPQKFDLSMFILPKKLQQIAQNRSAVSKKPKQQKCGEASNNKHKQNKDETQSTPPHKNIKQQLNKKPSNPINQAQRHQRVISSHLLGPQNNKSHSKSKSKSKSKIKKQNSFSKPAILKKSSQLHRIQEGEANEIVKNYSTVHSKNNENRAVKQTTIFKRRINVKCQDRVPVQMVPSQNQSQSKQQPNHQYQEELQKQPAAQQEHNNEQDQTFLDFYAIDLKLISKTCQKPKEEASMLIINKQLSSKLPQPSQEVEKKQEGKQQIKQEQKTVRKPQRRKIFQSVCAKSVQSPADVSIDNLSEQEMRMLLGAKGNKYKQAIVLQFIREMRKEKVK